MISKKTIYWIYPHFKFWMGGAKFLFEVGRRINRNKKYQVIFVANLGKKEIINKFKKERVNVITTSFISTNSLLYWGFLPFFLILDLISVFTKVKNYDILVATLFPSNLIASIISLLTKKPYIYYCYEPFPFFHSKKFIQLQPIHKRIFLSFLAKVYGWLDIWATRKAKLIITFDEEKRRQIKKIYQKDTKISSVGVDTNHFKPLDRSGLKSKHKNKNFIIHSTDYTELKKTDLALKAFQKLIKLNKVKNVVLLITSTRPDFPEKNKYIFLAKKLGIEKYVEFLGFLPYEKLPYYYSSAICYLSTIIDPFMISPNLPVKEALSCGTPVLRKKTEVIDVIDNVNGFIVNPKDSQEVANKIEFLIKNKKMRKIMGINGRKYIIKNYSWSKVIKNFLEFFSS